MGINFVEKSIYCHDQRCGGKEFAVSYCSLVMHSE